jgi:hypothetical protein
LSLQTLDEAANERDEGLFMQEIDRRLDLLLSNYQGVTANPRSMGYLRFLLKYYAKKAHPWRECFKDNFKRFGPKTRGLCGVLKDTIRQQTHWRGHNNPKDHGAPGVAIGEADKGAAPAWGGHHLELEDGCELDRAFAAEFPGVDEVPAEVFEILYQLAETCNVPNVLLGLEEPPTLEVAA